MRALKLFFILVFLSTSYSFAGGADFVEDFLPIRNNESTKKLKNFKPVEFKFSSSSEYSKLDTYHLEPTGLMRSSNCYMSFNRRQEDSGKKKLGDTLTVSEGAEWNLLEGYKHSDGDIALNFTITRQGNYLGYTSIYCPSKTSVEVLNKILREHLNLDNHVQEFQGEPNPENENLRMRNRPPEHQTVELQGPRGIG